MSALLVIHGSVVLTTGDCLLIHASKIATSAVERLPERERADQIYFHCIGDISMNLMRGTLFGSDSIDILNERSSFRMEP